MNSKFISPAFDEWEFSNPDEDCYRWKREDVVADLSSWSDGWSVWIREDDSDKIFDTGFDKHEGFRFLRTQIRAVNLILFESPSNPDGDSR
jgi:hypothetical protein